MKIKLTENSLKVNKFECQSVTINKLSENKYKGIMFRVKGYFEEILEEDKYGKKYIKQLKIRKSIESKNFEYDGIPPKSKSQLAFHASNNNGQYINYYDKSVKG